MSKGNTVTRPRTYRATPAMGAAIARAAAAAGVSEATWVRDIVHRAIPDETKVEDVMPKPSPRRRRPAPSVKVQAVAGLREVVGEAIGTLRQVAGIDRKRSGARLAEIDSALDLLLEAAVFLDRNKALLIAEPSSEPKDGEPEAVE